MKFHLNFVAICLLLWIPKIKTSSPVPPATPGTSTPPATPGTSTPPATPGTSTPPATPGTPTPSTKPDTSTPSATTSTPSSPDCGTPPTTGGGPTPTPISQPTCPAYCAQSQNSEDARDIADSQLKPETIASILPYRGKADRISIGQQIAEKNGWKYFVADDYIYFKFPDPQSPFKDMCFSLMKDVGVVLSGYLRVFFESKKEEYIIMALTLCPNIEYVKIQFNIQSDSTSKFDEMIETQEAPFVNMLRKWCAQDREKDEEGDLDHEKVMQDASSLEAEYKNGGWQEQRDQLETTLVRKSKKYALAVIQEFEKTNGDKAMEDIIVESVESYKLDPNLANAYAALTRFIKCQYQFIADIMRQYSTNEDRWSVWGMCFAVVDPGEWSKVNEAYQKKHPEDTLSQLVLKQNTQDKVMAEMMAAVVDPTFKPTAFAPKAPSASPGTSYLSNTHPNTLSSAPSPPPVSPTTLASKSPTTSTPETKPTTTPPTTSTPGPKPATAPTPTPSP